MIAARRCHSMLALPAENAHYDGKMAKRRDSVLGGSS
jgi:hypothetical protein